MLPPRSRHCADDFPGPHGVRERLGRAFPEGNVLGVEGRQVTRSSFYAGSNGGANLMERSAARIIYHQGWCTHTATPYAARVCVASVDEHNCTWEVSSGQLLLE